MQPKLDNTKKRSILGKYLNRGFSVKLSEVNEVAMQLFDRKKFTRARVEDAMIPHSIIGPFREAHFLFRFEGSVF